VNISWVAKYRWIENPEPNLPLSSIRGTGSNTMTKPTILIVEDDGILAIHLQDLLTRQGYQVLNVVPTGEKAVLETETLQPDLILMDIELAGEINGITAAEQISKIFNTPVIFLTGYSQDPMLQQAKFATPYGYLVKPVPERELAATIEMALYKFKIDQQIKLSESKYRSLIEQASDGIFLTDKKGNFLEINSSVCTMLGHSREEILQKNMVDIISPENLAAIPAHTEEMYDGTVIRVEREFVRKDGSRFLVEISGRMLDDGNLQGIVRDITERKQSEEKIKQINERFDLATRASNMGVWDWDIPNNILVWDDTMVKLYGIKKEDFSGAYEAWLNGLHPEDMAANNEISEKARRGEGEYDTEFRVIWPDGSIHWIKALGQVFRDASGNAVRMTGVNFDITQQKEAENLAERNEIRLRSLLEIAQYETKDTQDFLNFALEKAIQLTGSKIGYINFYDESRKEFTLNSWSKDVMKECSVVERTTMCSLEKTGFWGEVVRQRRSLVDNDFQISHPLKMGMPEGHVVIKKFLSTPVFVDKAIVAVVGMANKDADYNTVDELQLSLMMDSVWKIVEKSIAEENRRQLQDKFTKVFQSSPDAITISTLADGKYIDVNDGFCKMTGHKPEEIKGKTSFDISLWPDPELRHDLVRELTEKGEITNFEIPLQMKDGQIKTCLLSSKLMDINNEKCAISIVRDISERKSMEYKLQYSEERYRLLFEEMFEGFALHEIILDENQEPIDYRFLDINPAFEKQTGLRREEIIGCTVKEVMPQTEDYWIQTYGKVALTGETLHYENYSEAIGKWFSVTAFSPKHGQFAVTFEDITVKKEGDLALAESEEQFRSTFEQTAVGMAMVNLAGQILKVNRALGQMTGYSMDELVGNSITRITHPDDAALTEENLGKLQTRDLQSVQFVKRYIHKNGRIIWVSVSSTLIWDTAGKPRYFINQVQDITESKLAEKQIQDQLDELRRWNSVTLGRENRILELKLEVNKLLSQAQQPPRYTVNSDTEKPHD
jgi:PAS domain S-box-containing protein